MWPCISPSLESHGLALAIVTDGEEEGRISMGEKLEDIKIEDTIYKGLFYKIGRGKCSLLTTWTH
jgi:hypothetical protein